MGESCTFATEPFLPVTISYDRVVVGQAELSPSDRQGNLTR